MNKKLVQIFFHKFVKYFKLFLKKVFPIKLITTFFGIGYLPEWQDHWSTLFGIVFVAIVLHFFDDITRDITALTEEIFLASLILCFLSLIGIHWFKKENKDAKYEMTIHLVFGQILTFALSIPGIVSFERKVLAFNTALCTNFMYCSSWFMNVITYVPTILFPYFVFQFVNYVQFWPCYLLDKNYNNAISNTSLGFFNAVYASILIYFVSFVFLNLELVPVIVFYQSIFQLAFDHIFHIR